jgi:cysteine desulfuration protein SufE
MRLNEFVAELNELDPQEKLEWLIEFSEQLPESSAFKPGASFPETCRVQECQTPVHLWVDSKNGRVHIEADVPRKSPIVRGLVALAVCGLEGAEISEVLAIPDDLVGHLSLGSVLGMTRQQGFRGVIARIKRALRGSQE